LLLELFVLALHTVARYGVGHVCAANYAATERDANEARTDENNMATEPDANKDEVDLASM
jgi:hypothetical protein